MVFPDCSLNLRLLDTDRQHSAEAVAKHTNKISICDIYSTCPSKHGELIMTAPTSECNSGNNRLIIDTQVGGFRIDTASARSSNLNRCKNLTLFIIFWLTISSTNNSDLVELIYVWWLDKILFSAILAFLVLTIYNFHGKAKRQQNVASIQQTRFLWIAHNLQHQNQNQNQNMFIRFLLLTSWPWNCFMR